ncbi:MAG: fatty acid CoA ligase family protein [Desulfobacterales bacterium]|nr:fatty acid CoA ligase family protein [Desulfobacterales bacterium]
MNTIQTQTQNNTDRINVSMHLKEMARKKPYQRAVVYPTGRDHQGRVSYSHLTFLQLDRESDNIAHGLNKAGITRGTRTILMVRPGSEFFALAFALFKTGAIPVVVDPGMGNKRMLQCLKESRPDAFIGIPLAHVLRIIYPNYFKTIKTFITVGHRWFWGGLTLDHIRRSQPLPYVPVNTRKDETAAILFTTGSTGPARGTLYTHGIFDAQIRHIRELFNIGDDEIDLPTFPLFALFDPALGMTAVIPDMDPTKPACVNPEHIIEAIFDQGVTNMFASPALLNRVGHYGNPHSVKLPSIRRVVSAGAPVLPANIRQFSSMLSKTAEIFTPYGATEAMPVTCIGATEILSETQSLSEKGYGTCVGRPAPGIDVRLITIIDAPINAWSDDLVLSPGEIGEITVKGDVVTRGYFERPEAQSLAKIQDGPELRHRMGDLGWQDHKGRIWFCGRKTHRVITETGTLYTVPCEAIFNQHEKVLRSALVGIGPDRHQQIPVICIELKKEYARADRKKLTEELLILARASVQTHDIEHILYHKNFPVDIRHNSKIFREKLAVWAGTQIRTED